MHPLTESRILNRLMRLNLSIKPWKALPRPALSLPLLLAIFWATPDLRAAGVPVPPPVDLRADREDTGRRLVHLLDYVSRDYAGAVGENHILIAASEYGEQQEFTATILTLAARIPELQADPQIAEELRQLKAAVETKAAPQAVSALCHTLRNQIITRLAILAFPIRTPDLAAGAAYYKLNCAPCHGASGKGDGPSAAALNPKPANLAGERLTGISPFQITNTVRFGVKGTGMSAHSEMTDEQLWNIAFYTATLHLSPPAAAPATGHLPPLSLADLATRSDRELLNPQPANVALAEHPEGTLSAPQKALAAHPEGTLSAPQKALAAQLAWLRFHPPAPLVAPNDFGTARALLAAALTAYRAGDRDGAEKQALAAYLDGVEPFEVTLATRHGDFVGELESGLAAVRGGISKGVPAAELTVIADKANQLLYRGDSLMARRDLSPAVTFVTALAILLREGLEAILIVVMLLGIAGNTGSRRARMATHAGWLSALGLGGVTWAVSHWVLNFSGAGREALEGITALVAVGVLLYVGFWLHSKTEISHWHAYLKAKSLVDAGGLGYWGMFSAAFLAVYREAFETVLFFQTLWLEAGAAARNALLAGVALGGLAVALISVLLLQLGRQVPLRHFFLFSSLIMLVLAVILTGKGVHSMQEAGWLGYHPMGTLRLEFFGIYPTLQTLIPQLVVLLVCLWLWHFGGRSDTAANHKQPSTRKDSVIVSNSAQ